MVNDDELTPFNGQLDAWFFKYVLCIYIYTKVDDKLTPFNGQLDAWLRSKPAAGPPLSVVNTMIESWTYQYFMMGTCIYANAKEKMQTFVNLKHVGAVECLNNQANTLIKLVEHPRELAPVQVLSFHLSFKIIKIKFFHLLWVSKLNKTSEIVNFEQLTLI